MTRPIIISGLICARRGLAVVLAALLALSTLGARTQELPDLGDESAVVMSPQEERKLGERLMRQLRGSLRFVDDPETSDYIHSLGDRLVANSDGSRLDFFFFVVDEPSINAFALPGGFIGIHTGLILTSQSESELAAVLAHETAHVSQRHLARMFAENKRSSKQLIGALLAAIVLANAGETEGSTATLALAQAGLVQKQLNFTRAHEEEADRVGIRILADSGFDPRAMPTFFERLQNWNRLNETSLPEFLRTHPITTRRIAESGARADEYPYKQIPDSEEFHRIRAKLRASERGNVANIVKIFKENLSQGKYRNIHAERYGYTLALLRFKQYDAARSELAKLLRQDPDNVSYRILQAEIEMAAEQYKKALDLYTAAASRFPTNHSLRQYHAAALLKVGHAQEARALLKQAVKNQPGDPKLQKMLATAAGEAGERLEAHQALATYYYLNGNLQAAIEQLKIAQRFAGDSFYLRSSLEARTKEIQDELAEEKEN